MVIDTNKHRNKWERRKVLPYSRMPVNKWGRDNEVKKKKQNHHLATTVVVIDWGGSHQWMLTLVGEVWWETEYWSSLGLSPDKILKLQRENWWPSDQGKHWQWWDMVTSRASWWAVLKREQYQLGDISAKIPALGWIWGNTGQTQVEGHPGGW